MSSFTVDPKTGETEWFRYEVPPSPPMVSTTPIGQVASAGGAPPSLPWGLMFGVVVLFVMFGGK